MINGLCFMASQKEAPIDREQFCLTDEQFLTNEPRLPIVARGEPRVDDRGEISGVV
jgi:hypothetical protein